MTDSTPVYCLENRGHPILYHYLILMIGGLQHFEHLPKPVRFHTIHELPFQKETIELLKPEFEFVEDSSGVHCESVFGTPMIAVDNVERKYFQFLRTQLLHKNSLQRTELPTRLIYISRNKSHEQIVNQGIARRQVMNEGDVYSALQSLGFEFIHLESYSMKEKIQLFQEARMIVSPNGGALTMALFAHPTTHVIELHTTQTTAEDQYYNLCKGVDIQITRYTNVCSVDSHGNPTQPYLTGPYNFMIPDVPHFKEFIRQQLSN